MLGARSPTGRAPYTHLVGAGVGGQVAGRAPYTHLVGAGVGGQVAHREGRAALMSLPLLTFR